jgi:hypothetical protein
MPGQSKVIRDKKQSLSAAALALDRVGRHYSAMSEIIFEVREDEVAGGYVASALGFGIHTQAETLEELRDATREATDCYFDKTMDAPKVSRHELMPDGRPRTSVGAGRDRRTNCP